MNDLLQLCNWRYCVRKVVVTSLDLHIFPEALSLYQNFSLLSHNIKVLVEVPGVSHFTVREL